MKRLGDCIFIVFSLLFTMALCIAGTLSRESLGCSECPERGISNDLQATKCVITKCYCVLPHWRSIGQPTGICRELSSEFGLQSRDPNSNIKQTASLFHLHSLAARSSAWERPLSE